MKTELYHTQPKYTKFRNPVPQLTPKARRQLKESLKLDKLNELHWLLTRDGGIPSGYELRGAPHSGRDEVLIQYEALLHDGRMIACGVAAALGVSWFDVTDVFSDLNSGTEHRMLQWDKEQQRVIPQSMYAYRRVVEYVMYHVEEMVREEKEEEGETLRVLANMEG